MLTAFRMSGGGGSGEEDGSMRFSGRFLSICAAAAVSVGLASCSTPQAATTTGAGAAAATGANPAAEALLDRINIPYERFTLANGLTVIVHTDRKAPVVAVSMWYDVGSKDEAAGRTGFAHLFEHLMFNGTENAPGDFFEHLEEIGATDVNGTTNPDRTNYFQTVPTGALDRALFLESDRMGHLLGAVTQETLNNQRGVVQNEKRQGDNQPFGLLRYYIFENLTPRGHPYHHSTIGSMADLNAASMDDVGNWFRANYGPNNAVLVLAGDVDAATARPMVERWFGSIPRGPDVVERRIEIPTLPAPLHREVTDQIATTRILRYWAVPGWTSEEQPALGLAASVLGGLNSSRLDNALVRGEQLAVSVAASAQPFEDMGVFVIQADVRPGVDPDLVARRVDEITAEFLRDGPTAAELERAVMSGLSAQLNGLESVGGFGGKAVALAQSQLYTGNPGFYREQLRRFATATPTQVRDIASRWLSRPVFGLIYRPGTRTDSGDGRGGAVRAGGEADPFAAANYRTPTSANERAFGGTLPLGASPVQQTAAPAQNAETADMAPAQPDPRTITAGPRGAPRSPPELQPLGNLDFPNIERARLRNGIPVYFARRSTVPTLRVSVLFDAGLAADSRDRAGTQALMLGLMTEGTTTRDSRALAEEQERLGASVSAGWGADRTSIGMYMLRSNIRPSLSLLADVIRNPAFAPPEIERLRAQQLTGIAQELNSPNGLANRVAGPLLFGRDHPYGGIAGSGTVGSVRAITRDDLVNFHQSWIRPDNAMIFVVGDTDLDTIVRELNATLGDWQPPAVPRGVKNFDVAIPAQTPRILFVNRPNSPQSVIVAAQVLGVGGRDDLVVLRASNEVLGGGFLSRINMNLRERRGWSYGAGSSIGGQEQRVTFRVTAPVQADRTGDAVREIINDVTAYRGASGVTAAELTRTINSNVRSLPGSFETSGDVLGGMQDIVLLNRPDDYYEQLPTRYRALTADELNAALRAQVDPARFVYIIVGDERVVLPQLQGLGMPVEIVDRATLGGQ
jgi:zinc protease